MPDRIKIHKFQTIDPNYLRICEIFTNFAPAKLKYVFFENTPSLPEVNN